MQRLVSSLIVVCVLAVETSIFVVIVLFAVVSIALVRLLTFSRHMSFFVAIVANWC